MSGNTINEFANKQCTTALRGLAILNIMTSHVGISDFYCRLFNFWGSILYPLIILFRNKVILTLGKSNPTT